MSYPERFFDSVFFWKSAYEKSEAEQAKLLNTIYDLEQRNLSLLTKTDLTASGDNNSAIFSSVKRKEIDTSGNVAPSETNNKRARLNLFKNLSHRNPGADQREAESTQDEQISESCAGNDFYIADFISNVPHETNLYAATSLTQETQ